MPILRRGAAKDGKSVFLGQEFCISKLAFRSQLASRKHDLHELMKYKKEKDAEKLKIKEKECHMFGKSCHIVPVYNCHDVF